MELFLNEGRPAEALCPPGIFIMDCEAFDMEAASQCVRFGLDSTFSWQKSAGVGQLCFGFGNKTSG